jgi:hypothetical protein
MSSEDVSYIELRYIGQAGHAIIGFCALQAEEAVALGKYVSVAKPLWEPTTNLLAVLIGCAPSDLVYSHPAPDHNKPLDTPGHVEVSRAVEGVPTRFHEWEGFWVFVHFRDWDPERGVEAGFVDLYFDPQADVTHSITHDGAIPDAVLHRVESLQENIGAHLGTLTALVLGKAQVHLVVHEPERCTETPQFGGASIVLRGSIQ